MLCIKGGRKGDKNWRKHVRARYRFLICFWKFWAFVGLALYTDEVCDIMIQISDLPFLLVAINKAVLYTFIGWCYQHISDTSVASTKKDSIVICPVAVHISNSHISPCEEANPLPFLCAKDRPVYFFRIYISILKIKSKVLKIILLLTINFYGFEREKRHQKGLFISFAY